MSKPFSKDSFNEDQNNSNAKFEISSLFVPVLGLVSVATVGSGLYFGINSLRSIDNDPLHVKTDYKGVVKELGGLKEPSVKSRQLILKPKNSNEASGRLRQLKKEGVVFINNPKSKGVESKGGKVESMVFQNVVNRNASSLTKCLNILRKRNKDMDFDSVYIQNTQGYVRVCNAKGRVGETGQYVLAQEKLPYVSGEMSGLKQQYDKLKKKQSKVDYYNNGSIYYFSDNKANSMNAKVIEYGQLQRTLRSQNLKSPSSPRIQPNPSPL